MTVQATWLYAEREGEESVYPQVGGRSSSTWFQAVYWRCVAIFFASAARTSPDARRVLYTNVPTVPDVDGHDLGGFLEALGWEQDLTYVYNKLPGVTHEWQPQYNQQVWDFLSSLPLEGP